MKFSILLFLSFLFTNLATAELLIFPAGQTNSVLVETGEVVRIWHKDAPLNPQGYSSSFQVILSETNVFNREWSGGANRLEVAGPAQINFATNAKHIVLLDKYHSSEVDTIILRAGVTNTITVASNQTLRLLDWGGNNGPDIKFEIQKGTNSFSLFTGLNGNVRDLHELDLSGPFLMKIQGANVLLSYYIANDFTSLPPYADPQATGNHQIVIETSSDLEQWKPAFMNRSQSAGKAFYRFKVGR